MTWPWLASHSVLDPDTGCLLWQGGCERGGYPTVACNGAIVRVPRLVCAWSYGATLADVPSWLHTRHLCGEPRCIEPDHLAFGTAAMNVADTIAAGTHPTAFTGGRCRNGHDVTDPANLYVSPDGRRACRGCRREAARARRAGNVRSHDAT